MVIDSEGKLVRVTSRRRDRLHEGAFLWRGGQLSLLVERTA
jgi:hypothetical protein